jgi:hypothetical protein
MKTFNDLLLRFEKTDWPANHGFYQKPCSSNILFKKVGMKRFSSTKLIICTLSFLTLVASSIAQPWGNHCYHNNNKHLLLADTLMYLTRIVNFHSLFIHRLIIIIPLFLLSTSTFPQHWSGPYTLMYTYGINSPNFTVDNKGVIHCVWSHLINYQFRKIYYSCSIDKGFTWNTPEDISLNTSLWLDYPQIIADSSRNLYVSYDFNIGGYPITSIFYKKFDGTNWSIQYLLSDSIPAAQWSRIAIDNNDRIYFFWFAGTEYYRYLEKDQLSDIFYLSKDSLMWCWFDKIVMDKQNRLHCVGTGLLAGQDTGKGIYINFKDGEWSNPVKLYNKNFYNSDLSIDNLNNPSFSWTCFIREDSLYNPIGGSFYLKYFADSLNDPIFLAGNTTSTSITIDNHNHPHIVDNERIGHEFLLVHHFNYGEGWQSEVIDEVYLPDMTYGFYCISLARVDSSVYLLYVKVDTTFYMPGVHYTPVIFRKYDLPLGINQKVYSSDIIAFPNPFSDNVKIQVTSQNQGLVKMKIYNQVGQVIIIANSKRSSDGSCSFLWNGCDTYGQRMPSGLYYLQISIDEKIIIRKLILF